MRYDIRILWVDDSPRYYEETKEVLEMYIEDMGISVRIDYIDDALQLGQKLEQEKNGFKSYDIFFIDYSLSRGVVGSSIIKELRKMSIDSDILFYSSEHESDIRQVIIDNLGSFEGVYIANRKNFEEKANYLIKKNTKRLLSLSNIRGVLTDQTSENDFIIISYILTNFDSLNPEEKQELSQLLLESMESKKAQFESKVTKQIEKIKNQGITNINRLFDLPNYLFSIEMKYMMFEKMISYKKQNAFDEYSIEKYLNEIVKIRNTIAHKKLDICKTQKYILYCDNIKQLSSRRCPEDCIEHQNNNKMSIEQWEETRKDIISYGKCFDIILEEIMEQSFGVQQKNIV